MSDSPHDHETDVPASSAAFADAPTDPEPAEVEPSPLEQAKKDHAELKDRYLRLAADYDNHRKRTRKEVEDAEKKGRETLLKELLPVFDNLELAVQHAKGATDAAAVADGLRMVLRQFLDALERGNIRRVETKGSFDPMVHEAVQQLETDEQPPGAIVAEVQAGYQMGERLVRPAMVVVAKAKPAS